MGPPDSGAGPIAAVLAAMRDIQGKPRRFFGRAGDRLVLVQVWYAGARLETEGATGAAKKVLVKLVTDAGEPMLRKTLLAAAEKLGVRPEGGTDGRDFRPAGWVKGRGWHSGVEPGGRPAD